MPRYARAVDRALQVQCEVTHVPLSSELVRARAALTGLAQAVTHRLVRSAAADQEMALVGLSKLPSFPTAAHVLPLISKTKLAASPATGRLVAELRELAQLRAALELYPATELSNAVGAAGKQGPSGDRTHTFWTGLRKDADIFLTAAAAAARRLKASQVLDVAAAKALFLLKTLPTPPAAAACLSPAPVLIAVPAGLVDATGAALAAAATDPTSFRLLQRAVVVSHRADPLCALYAELPAAVVLVAPPLGWLRAVETFSASRPDPGVPVSILHAEGGESPDTIAEENTRETRAFERVVRLANAELRAGPVPINLAVRPRQLAAAARAVLSFTESPLFLIDNRELRSDLPVAVSLAGIAVRVATLPTADYVVAADTGVERKAPEDLVASLAAGRVLKQAAALHERYAVPVLLVDCSGKAHGDVSGLIARPWAESAHVAQQLALVAIAAPWLRVLWAGSIAESVSALTFLAQRSRAGPPILPASQAAQADAADRDSGDAAATKRSQPLASLDTDAARASARRLLTTFAPGAGVPTGASLASLAASSDDARRRMIKPLRDLLFLPFFD
jgi:ERCC4-type nuclease